LKVNAHFKQYEKDTYYWNCLISRLHLSNPKNSAPSPRRLQGKNYEAKDLAAYSASLPPIYKKYGGKYVAFSPKYVTLGRKACDSGRHPDHPRGSWE